MEVSLPAATGKCSGLSGSDFDEYKIPVPPRGYREDKNTMFLLFLDSEEAIKYAIHLNDVHERMELSSEYNCSRKKIQQIIKAVNEQTDFTELTFE
jgi:hypothetical protein